MMKLKESYSKGLEARLGSAEVGVGGGLRTYLDQVCGLDEGDRAQFECEADEVQRALSKAYRLRSQRHDDLRATQRSLLYFHSAQKKSRYDDDDDAIH